MTGAAESAEAQRLHDDALVVDGACPLLVVKEFVDWYMEGGVDIVTPTVGVPSGGARVRHVCD